MNEQHADSAAVDSATVSSAATSEEVSTAEGEPSLAAGGHAEKLIEILARVEAIERSLFDTDSPLQARIDTAGVADELLRALRPLLESQEAAFKAALAEQLTGAASPEIVPTPTPEPRASLPAFAELAPVEPAPIPAPPPAPVEAPAPRSRRSDKDDRGWQTVIFSAELLDDPAIAPQLQTLSSQILSREPAPSVLAGQLLIFQNASPERRPQLLKEVGEAYYRCFPKTADVETPLEEALARWLERACDQAGYLNTIELVRPGQRFDSTRHLADRPGGVEITQVHGWVVLRSQNKVYTKASVSAR